MNKNTQTIVSVLIVVVFIIGGVWYYRSMQSSQPNFDGKGTFVPPVESGDRGGMQLPTEAPHVTPPTTPPPAR